MLFKVLKRCIERQNYSTKESMSEKIAILYADEQLTQEEYRELIDLLKKEK